MKILVLILLIITSEEFAQAYEKIYDFQFVIRNTGEITLTYAKIIEGYKTIPSDYPTAYYLKIYSKNKEIYSLPFPVTFGIKTEPPIDIMRNSTAIELRIPFF